MTEPGVFHLDWVPRKQTLQPTCIFARGDAAKNLARHLCRLDPERLGRLKGMVGDKDLVVTGPADHLPWVPGLVYLGVDPEIPGLYLPTAWQTRFPNSLLLGVLSQMGLETPAAVVHQPPCGFSLKPARPMDGQLLRQWAPKS